MAVTKAFKPDEKLFDSLQIATDYQPDEVYFSCEEISRENHHVFLSVKLLGELDHILHFFLFELPQLNQDCCV
jgi:hypothetical protein